MIVSHAEKSNASFAEILRSFSCGQIVVAGSCSEARKILSEQYFDLVIINVPLKDESGEKMARDVALKEQTGQVMLVVKSEYYDEISETFGDYGVIAVAKPVNKDIFRSALGFVKATQCKLKKLRSENAELTKKLEDIRIVSRAKCLIVSSLNMNENEAHKYIERQAMDMRTSRRAIAEGVIKTYGE